MWGDPAHARESSQVPCLSALQMFRHTDSLFPILLQTLSDESDEVGSPYPCPCAMLPSLPLAITDGIS